MSRRQTVLRLAICVVLLLVSIVLSARKSVLSVGPPAHDQIAAFSEFVQKAGDHLRLILQVGVACYCYVPPGGFEAVSQSYRLAAVAGISNDADVRVLFPHLLSGLEGGIAAAVVYEDEFEWLLDIR